MGSVLSAALTPGLVNGPFHRGKQGEPTSGGVCMCVLLLATKINLWLLLQCELLQKTIVFSNILQELLRMFTEPCPLSPRLP